MSGTVTTLPLGEILSNIESGTALGHLLLREGFDPSGFEPGDEIDVTVTEGGSIQVTAFRDSTGFDWGKYAWPTWAFDHASSGVRRVGGW